jgi:CRP-like cAMP-binding protein
VPDGLQLVGDVERMLVLRRVPLFASLDPEDLQRVAAAAIEGDWAEGDALMTEGDLGSDLVVVVEGSVRVVHQDVGGEHVLRRVGQGEHIGELAVLREAPRAATVIAEAPGVHGLVISGEAVEALLRERPGAAMAMLATLAERIGQQG